MKSFYILSMVIFYSMNVAAQEVLLNKTFVSIEMTAVKMLDQTTLYRIDTIPVKLGKYQLDEIACHVFLKDMNGNGKFNEVGIDEIGLLDKYTDTIEHSYQGGISFAPLNNEPAVLVDDMLLSVLHIDEDGSSMQLKEVGEASLTALAWTVTYLPDLELKLLNGTKTNLIDFLQEEKYIYIEFWGTWCEPCLELMPQISAIDILYNDKVKIVGLNYGDKIEDAMLFIKRNKINWTQAIVDRSVLSKFSVTTVPRGVLFDKAGNILDMNMSPSELNTFLKNQ